MERPNWGALEGMLKDLKRVAADLPNIQQRMQEITGEAWSEDRSVKAVVGPRGHLMELEIDPRVFRKPDSKALAAMIVATVQQAIEDVARQSKEIYEQTIPIDAREAHLGNLNVSRLFTTDADLRQQGDEQR